MGWSSPLELYLRRIALARSITVQAGALRTKISPPLESVSACSTRSTDWSSVSRNRVIRGMVTRSGFPSSMSWRKSGITDPRLPITLP